MERREGVVTFEGNPLVVVGPALEVGDAAPDFTLVKNDLSEATLKDYAGKPLLLSVVPSLDTPVCDLQAKRFNEEAAKREGASIVTVSVDLPFAQARWCGAVEAGHVQTLSDHRDVSLGEKYGVLIDGLRLLARAVFVIDASGILRYQEIVPELTEHPDYEAALAALDALL